MRLGGPARQLILTFLIATACGDDEGVGGGGGGSGGGGPYGAGVCEALVDKVSECGVATADGTVGCSASGLSTCEVQCMADAGCDELSELRCDGAISQALLDCFGACGQPSLMCADDSGPYKPEQRCDGFPFCSDGSDEDNCATFECGDGSTIPVQQRCDTTDHCPDGSDELDCTTFMSSCGSGGEGGSSGGSGGAVASGGEGGSAPEPRTYIEATTESCDRIQQKLADCDTSGDYYLYCYGDTFTYDKCMADCFQAASCDDAMASACNLDAMNDFYTCWNDCSETAYFICEDGSEVPEYSVCDEVEDCADGTDEAGCPMPTEYECPDDAGTFYTEADRCDEFNSCATLPSADEANCACLP